MNNSEQQILSGLDGSQPVLVCVGKTLRDSIIEFVKGQLAVSESDIEFFEEGQTIAQLREAMKRLSTRPHSSAVRLFVVDGADVLGRATANTLLKTLEEPPEYLRTILFCDSLAKVISTIKSRCKSFVIGSATDAVEGENFYEFFRHRDFIEFSKTLSKLENAQIVERLKNTLEVMRLKELNSTSSELYKKLSEVFIRISNSNMNFKLQLESVFINFLSKNG